MRWKNNTVWWFENEKSGRTIAERACLILSPWQNKAEKHNNQSRAGQEQAVYSEHERQ